MRWPHCLKRKEIYILTLTVGTSVPYLAFWKFIPIKLIAPFWGRFPTLKNRPRSTVLGGVLRERVVAGLLVRSVHPMHLKIRLFVTWILSSVAEKVIPLLHISITSDGLALLTQFIKAATLHAGPGESPCKQFAINFRPCKGESSSLCGYDPLKLICLN